MMEIIWEKIRSVCNSTSRLCVNSKISLGLKGMSALKFVVVEERLWKKVVVVFVIGRGFFWTGLFWG